MKVAIYAHREGYEAMAMCIDRKVHVGVYEMDFGDWVSVHKVGACDGSCMRIVRVSDEGKRLIERFLATGEEYDEGR